MTCDEVRVLAPEAALDLLDGAARADVVAHVSGCVPCRTELAELSAAADALLVAAPPAEPPPGFESRVLARFTPSPDPGAWSAHRRRWLRPAIAVAAAAVIGLVVGFALRGGGDAGNRVEAASLVGSDGRAIGRVVISSDPNVMVCVLDDAPVGARYSVSVVTGANVDDLGSYTVREPGFRWAAALPVDGASVRRVVVRDAGGAIRGTATLPGYRR